jgi:tetratricopeptide (TPR) repeat protein
MESNSIYDIEKLDKYLSGELPASEMGAINERLKTDLAMQQEINLLRTLQETIRKEAIRQKVKFLQTQFLNHNPIEEGKGEKVVPIKHNVRWTLRIAASFLIAALGYGIYQFSTTHADGLYRTNFVSYKLPVLRGAEEDYSLLDSLYHAQQYEAVISKFAEVNNPQPHDNFLAAMSFMQIGDFAKAQTALKVLVKRNNENDTRFFEQEAEYYLALTYIQTNNIDSAIFLFEKIKEDRKHLYHYNVSNTDVWRLRILRVKS